MRTVGVLLLLVGAALLYLGEFDRKSELALYVVEVDSRLRFIKAWALAGLAGVALVLPGLLAPLLRRGGVDGPSRAGHRSSPRPVGGPSPAFASSGGSWSEAVRARLRAYEGAGCRILFDQAQGLPVTLQLEHLSPRHVDEAVAALGQLFQTLPLPPRLRVRFLHCPEGPGPRHHQVARALGQHIDPGRFKAVANADQVDVIFHDPDPRWRTDW